MLVAAGVESLGLASVPEATSNPLSEEIAQVEVKALVAVVFRVEIAVRFAIAASVTSLEKVTGPAGLVQEAEIGLTAVNFRLFAEMELVEAPVSFVFYGGVVDLPHVFAQSEKKSLSYPSP